MVLNRKTIDFSSNESLIDLLESFKWEEVDRQDKKYHSILAIDTIKQSHLMLADFVMRNDFLLGEYHYKADSKRIERTHRTKVRPNTWKEKFF